MNILNFDYSDEHGFAWITVDTNENKGEWTVQCCLKSGGFNDEGQYQGCLIQIDQSDCGHDEGICADVNGGAFEYWGENRCMTALFDQARKAGIQLND